MSAAKKPTKSTPPKKTSAAKKSAPDQASAAETSGAAAKPSAETPMELLKAPAPSPDSGLTQAQADLVYTKLIAEKDRVSRGMQEHLSEAIAPSDQLTDEVDVAQRHTEQAYLIRFADKERKLLREIERALEKFAEGEYGVCEGTGEPIAFKRLELRPWTRYSVAYKEQIERERKQHARD